jgi:hypothetical protein
MTALRTYRLRYRVTETCDVDIKAFSPEQAIEHLRGLLEIGPLAVETSKTIHSEFGIAAPTELGGAP